MQLCTDFIPKIDFFFLKLRIRLTMTSINPVGDEVFAAEGSTIWWLRSALCCGCQLRASAIWLRQQLLHIFARFHHILSDLVRMRPKSLFMKASATARKTGSRCYHRGFGKLDFFFSTYSQFPLQFSDVVWTKWLIMEIINHLHQLQTPGRWTKDALILG